MKYFLLLAGSAGTPWDQLTPDEQMAEMAKHEEFGAACEERAGVELLGGEALGDGSTATTVRPGGGDLTVTDGPFAEAAEQIGGYYLLEAPDLDTVVELCQILPYVIDIRPVLDLS